MSESGDGVVRRVSRPRRVLVRRVCSCCAVAAPRPAPLTEDERPNPWVATDGFVSHPDAPRGAGGPGFFRGRSQIDGPGGVSQTVPHPHSAAGDDLLLEDNHAESLQVSANAPTNTAAPKKNPPPATVTKSKQIKKNVGTTHIDVTVKVLADVSNSGEVASGAHTKLDPGQVAPDWPDITTDAAGTKVTGEDGPIKLEGEITICIHYASGVKPSDDVAYGRGTKPDDITNGDITIGFHESCHLNEYWAWMTTKDFPTFKGKVGDSVTKYQEEQEKTDKAWEKFLADAAADTLAKTDEVGDPTLSQHNAKNSP